jgi:hypothetical protein
MVALTTRSIVIAEFMNELQSGNLTVLIPLGLSTTNGTYLLCRTSEGSLTVIQVTDMK